jgi:hypothetical protein
MPRFQRNLLASCDLDLPRPLSVITHWRRGALCQPFTLPAAALMNLGAGDFQHLGDLVLGIPVSLTSTSSACVSRPDPCRANVTMTGLRVWATTTSRSVRAHDSRTIEPTKPTATGHLCSIYRILLFPSLYSQAPNDNRTAGPLLPK